MGIPLRWVVLIVIALSSALNYLTRQTLPALAPVLRSEFDLSNADYGFLLSAFSIAYAVSAPLSGWFIDRVGLSRGIVIVVTLWSLLGAGTGLVYGFLGLLFFRAGLGVVQAGGVPATGKATAIYLPPRERALGTATTQIGLSLGAIAAPLVVSWLSGSYGWRSAFVLTGVCGLLWVPLWLVTARRISPLAVASEPAATPPLALLRDRRLWGLIIATVLYMSLYSLWSNWTTVYLVEEQGLTQQAANRTLAWIPPIFANLGGLFGGWLALRWIRGGVPVLQARMRVNRWSALVLLLTAAVPFIPSTGAATALICLSFFWVTAMSVNVYAMPLDIFGAWSAALAVSTLTGAYGLMQTFVSPLIGVAIDHYGFQPVCLVGAALPLAAVVVLRRWTEQPS
jgi:ACS family hexuronate transporter-like MFS transporter